LRTVLWSPHAALRRETDMTAELIDEKAAFNIARRIDCRDTRDQYLQQICGTDGEKLRRLNDLLELYDKEQNFLDQPAVATPVSLPEERPGSQIGPYQLLEQIGEGGFGVVYLAEQERPVRRKVALKIIKPGMDTRQVIARFEAERQALALMDHPNIAKVFDAGSTENGRPYFVMELVRGVPITEYCDQCSLATRERLELFITVCQAVQHAHQKGIIHRDIKPTNVLVSRRGDQDGKPAPKIIDFGVAKAINQQLTEHSLATGFAQMIGSPLYMSPEQAELTPLGVDTRSDIYSLGVLLYELLTGTTPFEKERLKSAPFDELRRIIREEEPKRPSERISTLEAAAISTIAERRHTDGRRLHQTVRGELDWIVMKCLEKDRNRRYETAIGLARDIERYMSDEAVQACPPSTAYRLKKFIRRNKIAAAFVLLLVAAVAGLTVSNIQSSLSERRANAQTARAQEISDLLQRMLRSANPDEAKDAEYTVRQMLDDFADSFGNGLDGQPEVEAEIRATIGGSYWRLGVADKAEPHLTRALELRRDLFGPDYEGVAEILVDYAWCLNEQSRLPEAADAAREALRIYRASATYGSPVLRASAVLQRVLISLNRLDEAQTVTEEAMALTRDSAGEYREIAVILHGQADLLVKLGRYSEAEQAARQAVQMHRRLNGPGHPETAWGLRALADALGKQKEYSRAEDALREALTIFRQRYRGNHHSVNNTLADLKQVLEAQGDRAGLESLASEEAELESLYDNPGYHLRVAGLLLQNNPSANQKEEARRLTRRAIEGYGQVAVDYPDDLNRRLKATQGYVDVVRLAAVLPDFADEVDEAHRRFSSEIQSLLVTFPKSTDCQWQCAMLYRGWAFAVSESSSYIALEEQAHREAIRLLESETLVSANPLRNSHGLASTHGSLGDFLLRTGRLEDAEQAFRGAIGTYEQRPAEPVREPVEEVELVVDYSIFACLLADTQRQQEAVDLLRAAALAAERINDPSPSASALACLGIARLRVGDAAGYREACASLVKLPFRLPNDDANLSRIRVCCLGPAALDDPSLVIKLAEDFAANNSLGAPSLGHVMLGSAHFRAGHYQRAAQHLEESHAHFPGDAQSSLPPDRIMPRLLLAMTKWQLNKHDEARRILRELQPRIDEVLESASTHWDRRAVLEIRRREAEAMIKPKEGDEGGEKEIETSDDQ
jgi:serine/threonine protein kinase